MSKRVLLLGGTGAIGIYLTPELLKLGFQVDVTSRKVRSSDNKNLKYIHGNAHDIEFLQKTLHASKYDAIVDFMIYNTNDFRGRYNLLLENCRHYIFLSSYRVFADADIITEETPRLIDTLSDKDYLSTDEYAIAKARQEDILQSAGKTNWTIVRPSITYSRARFQFGTLEADTLVWRALQNLPVILPKPILNRRTTMTWAGDTARLIAKLVLNKKTFTEDYNIATKENHTWAEIAEIYSEIMGLKIQPVADLGKYLETTGGGKHEEYLVKYNRMYDRILDNTKILRITGETQENFMGLQEGLKSELSRFIENPHFENIDYAKQARIDRLTHTRANVGGASSEEKRTYQATRFPKRTAAKNLLRPRARINKAKGSLLSLKHKTRIRTRIKEANEKVVEKYKENRYKKFDGAVVTLNDYSNYGNTLQCFALQEFLRKNGYKFLSYDRDLPTKNDLSDVRIRWTAEFVKTYIPKKSFNPQDNFSTYIVGSDQVWRKWWWYDNEKEQLGYFFLNFVNNPKARLIAYAASFGKSSLIDAGISRKLARYISPYIKRFHAVSLREDSGIDIVQKEWGIKADKVVDPTMLLKKEDYKLIIEKSKYKLNKVEEVFVYLIAKTDQADYVISAIARAKKASISEIKVWQPGSLPPVEQWLKGFYESKIAVTDSFHGTIFSIINNTDFIVVENDIGGVSRIISLLRYFDLEDRLVLLSKAKAFNYKNLKPINWDSVNSKIENLREQSAGWLLDSLK